MWRLPVSSLSYTPRPQHLTAIFLFSFSKLTSSIFALMCPVLAHLDHTSPTPCRGDLCGSSCSCAVWGTCFKLHRIANDEHTAWVSAAYSVYNMIECACTECVWTCCYSRALSANNDECILSFAIPCTAVDLIPADWALYTRHLCAKHVVTGE